jgi:antitoxin VapB
MYVYTQKGLDMAVTRIFRNGNSQAVRIPAELAYDRSDLDVEIERVGDELRIRPAGRSLDGALAKFTGFSADFMSAGREANIDSDRDAL